MTALRATIIEGIPVVVDDDAPPALRVVAACVTEAAVSLVLLALQALLVTDPELFAVPLVGDGPKEPQGPDPTSVKLVHPTVLDTVRPMGGAEHMNRAQPLVYEQVRRLGDLRPLTDPVSVAAHFGLDVAAVEAIWASPGVTADDGDGGPKAA